MTQLNPKHTVEFEECSDNNNRPSKISKIEEEMNQHHHHRKIQRYLVAVEYIGTRFFGFQKQLTDRTVAGVLEVSNISQSHVMFL